MDEKEYISRQLSKADGKSFESYVIHRIYHLLKIDDLQIITQQYVRRPNGYALTDMYLPQIKLHIEVDEPAHEKQIIEDIDRQRDIIEATDHEILRVKIHKETSLSSLNTRIDEVCYHIAEKINKLKVNKEWVSWFYDNIFDTSKYKSQGFIDTNGQTIFPTIVEACNLLGQEYKGAQKAWYKAKKYSNYYLWFPKFYENSVWDNGISKDGKTIRMYAKQKNTRIESINLLSKLDRKNVIVFPRFKTNLGEVFYRFIGVFEISHNKSSVENGVIYTKSSDRFNLDHYQKLGTRV